MFQIRKRTRIVLLIYCTSVKHITELISIINFKLPMKSGIPNVLLLSNLFPVLPLKVMQKLFIDQNIVLG